VFFKLGFMCDVSFVSNVCVELYVFRSSLSCSLSCCFLNIFIYIIVDVFNIITGAVFVAVIIIIVLFIIIIIIILFLLLHYSLISSLGAPPVSRENPPLPSCRGYRPLPCRLSPAGV
jgi:hypothetical protein